MEIYQLRVFGSVSVCSGPSLVLVQTLQRGGLLENRSHGLIPMFPFSLPVLEVLASYCTNGH